MPSYVPNLTFLVPFPTDFAYLSMLFILEVLCTAGRAEHLKNKLTCSNKQSLLEMVLEMSDWAHMMALGVLNAMVPRL